MQARTFAILVSILILIFVIDLIRRQKMTFKYSIVWLSTCLMALFFAVNDALLYRLSKIAGFSLASNFIFFLIFAFFTVLSLLLTLYINEQNSRTESLAQAIGILEYKLKKMETSGKVSDKS